MVEHHAVGALLGEQPGHPEVASGGGYEDDAQCEQGEVADEERYDGGQESHDDEGHECACHIASDGQRLAAMAVGGEQFPHHAEADAAPPTLGKERPREAVNELVDDDADEEYDEEPSPADGEHLATGAPPNQKEEGQEQRCRHKHDDDGDSICLHNVDGHFPSYFLVFFHIGLFRFVPQAPLQGS